MNREAAARKIQAAFRRGRRPKANQFVNKFNQFDYALTKPTINSIIVSTQVPFTDLIDDPLPPGVDELLGYTAVGKKPVVRKIRGRNAPLGANKTNTYDVKRWVFTINFKNPDSKAYVSHTASGALQINTTGPYERVIRLLNKTYFPDIINAPIKIVKVDTKMYINRYINLDGLGDELRARVPKSKLVKWSYEPELMPGAYLTWGSPKASLVLYTSGVILTLGLKSVDALGATSEILKEIFEKYSVDKTKVFKYSRNMGYRAIAIPEGPVRKNLAAKRARAAGRYQLAYSWNNSLEGYYVRPGANGKPRFYPLVANLKLVRPKVVRAYANAGVAIPQGVRNALDITANAAPVAKVEGRRATNWSSTKNGYYVKPGPGGQPYFYKIPKGKAAAKKTVVAAYRNVGVTIPQAVKNLFSITGNNTGGSPKKTQQHYVNYNAQGGLRINGKQFSRFTQSELVQIARNLNIPQVNASTKLVNIARYIRNAVGNTNNAVNATLAGANILFMNNGRVKRGVRARQWATLKADEQAAIARAFLKEDEYETYSKLAKVNKYPYILAMKKYRRDQQQESARRAVNEAVSESSGSVNENFAKNLEIEMQARALLGNNANNANVNKLKAVLLGLPSGARGGPRAANVKKAFKEFKHGSQLANIRRMYAAAIRVPNWLPGNLHAGYRSTLTNIATAPNNKGRLPNKEAIKRGMKAWLNQKLPQQARVAHEKENIITGEIIKVPAWDPGMRASPNLPNQPVRKLGPARKRKEKVNGPVVGPVKKAKKDPRENKNYPVPRNANAENLVNAIANLGLPIGPSNKYSWTYLSGKGLNNRFYQNWANFTASPNVPLTVNAAKSKLNTLKTAKARQEWTVAHKNKFTKENYYKILNHRKNLDEKNKERRAAKRNQGR